ncbi:MAG: ISAs1 family transposase, partial [Rhodocyclaceae bacterium]
VKENHPPLAHPSHDFFSSCRAAPAKTPYSFFESIEKDHGRIEQRRSFPYDQLQCLSKPDQWPDLQSFVVIEAQRTIRGKTSVEHRYYISSLPADAPRIGSAIRQHWAVENRLHWCMDVAFADDQMRLRTGYAAHNLAVLKHITMNLIRLDPVPRKGGIKVRRLIAATSDNYRAHLFGLV